MREVEETGKNLVEEKTLTIEGGESYELAFRMQPSVPKLMDLSDETQETLTLYGIGEGPTDDFGRQCLMARRFIESGVRFVQVTHSYKWDQRALAFQKCVFSKTWLIDSIRCLGFKFKVLVISKKPQGKYAKGINFVWSRRQRV